ncbi:MAG: flagellar filament outer layer protein FlaA [Spirochaetota bacterium]
MKRGGLLSLCLILLFSVFLAAGVSADTDTENLVSQVLESYDDPGAGEWAVMSSKFITNEYPKTTYVTAWPSALFGSNKDGKDLKVLGVKAKFDRKGYNYIELIPPEKKRPFMIPGKVKMLDIWVWGSNYDYYMEVHVRDYRGIVHVLPLGDLKYVGWKDLKVQFPSFIPQEGGHVKSGGFEKELELVKFVIWTRPEEDVSGFQIYFDQIKVLTDVFVSRFDGDDLAGKESDDSVWSGGGGK